MEVAIDTSKERKAHLDVCDKLRSRIDRLDTSKDHWTIQQNLISFWQPKDSKLQNHCYVREHDCAQNVHIQPRCEIEKAAFKINELTKEFIMRTAE